MVGHTAGACRGSCGQKGRAVVSERTTILYSLHVSLDSWQHLSLSIPLANFYEQGKPSRSDT